MRRLGGAIALAIAGCSGDPREVAAPPAATPPPAEAAAPAAPEYAVAEPNRLSSDAAVALPNGYGALLHGARVVVDGGNVRVIDGPTLSRVARVPQWLGGGLLFSNGSAVFAATSFDAPLRPLVGLPSSMSHLSFGPRAALVRSGSDARFLVALPSGTPAPVSPLGLHDVVALADGRGLALTDLGLLFVTIDRGANWIDATNKLSSPPASIHVLPLRHKDDGGASAALDPWGELWASDEAGHAYVLETSGALREHDRLPTPPKRPLVPNDPSWHENVSPVTIAMTRGVPIGPTRSLVAASGDVVEVDLVSGAISYISRGKLPVDTMCEGFESGGEILFACAASGHRAAVFKDVRTGNPKLEKGLPEGGTFFASDDGSIAYSTPCESPSTGPKLQACARDGRGEWYEVDLDQHVADAGADASIPLPPAPEIKPKGKNPPARPPAPGVGAVVRWIPRADKKPLALVHAHALIAIVDPEGGVTPLDDKVSSKLLTTHRSDKHVIDRTWSADASGTRMWLQRQGSARLTLGGGLDESPFHYDRLVHHGASALASDRHGRLFQSTDRGVSWTEVAAPPGVHKHTLDLRECSASGALFDHWVRLGWRATPPSPRVDPPALPPAPSLATAPPRVVTCAAAQPEQLRVAKASSAEQGALGLGARVLSEAIVKNNSESFYRRWPHSREPSGAATGQGEERALRAMIHGYSAVFASPDTTVARPPFAGIAVQGPRASPDAFKRTIDFWEPFDPAANVRTGSFDARALTPFAITNAGFVAIAFSGEGPIIDAFVPIFPLDPASGGGLLFSFPMDGGHVLGVVRGDGKSKGTGASPARATLKLVGSYQDDGTPVSAVEIAPGELAVLIEGGPTPVVLHVSSLGNAGVAGLHTPPSLGNIGITSDTLAVGPKGALFVLRVPASTSPPSAEDRAFVFPASGGPPEPLAPWSSLTLGDDPACKSEAGFRAQVTPRSSWITVRGGRQQLTGPMSARVRWSATRVCLDAVEIPEGTKNVRNAEVETAIVWRIGGEAARVAFAPGVELRQAMSCSLVPR